MKQRSLESIIKEVLNDINIDDYTYEAMDEVPSAAKVGMVKSTIYNEVKGWDTYWNADMPR